MRYPQVIKLINFVCDRFYGQTPDQAMLRNAVRDYFNAGGSYE